MFDRVYFATRTAEMGLFTKSAQDPAITKSIRELVYGARLCEEKGLGKEATELHTENIWRGARSGILAGENLAKGLECTRFVDEQGSLHDHRCVRQGTAVYQEDVGWLLELRNRDSLMPQTCH